MRSIWKGQFSSHRIFKSFEELDRQKRNEKVNYLNKLINLKYLEKNLNHFIYNKNSTISLFFLNKRVAVYTGNKFHSFLVKKNMINHKFGEFVLTKKLGIKNHREIIKASKNRK